MSKRNPKPLTEDQKKMNARIIGLFAGIMSKALLQYGGCEVDYKINGEDIDNLQKLQELEIRKRIELAVKEERYEDAAKLKRLLEKQRIDEEKIENKITANARKLLKS